MKKIRALAAQISEEYRKANRLNQTRLAKKAGVSLKSIYNIEHENAVYDETLQKVMKVCGYNYKITVLRELEKDDATCELK